MSTEEKALKVIETGVFAEDFVLADEYVINAVYSMLKYHEKQAKNNESLHLVSHCPLCNSKNLHQYKLQHIHCKDCKENFDKSCD